jgi:hypothetical protein
MLKRSSTSWDMISPADQTWTTVRCASTIGALAVLCTLTQHTQLRMRAPPPIKRFGRVASEYWLTMIDGYHEEHLVGVVRKIVQMSSKAKSQLGNIARLGAIFYHDK